MFFEYCNGGDLDQFVCLQRTLSEETAKKFIKMLIAALNDLHKINAIHRDIKLANILLHFPDIDESLITHEFLKSVDLSKVRCELKLADLGFAKVLKNDEMTKTMCGTPLNMAPEVLFS